MAIETLYAFTDVSGQHILNIGPGGWGWTPIDSPLAETETFVVCGDDNARDFQQWHKNEDRHIRRVAVGDVPESRLALPIDADIVTAYRHRNGVTG